MYISCKVHVSDIEEYDENDLLELYDNLSDYEQEKFFTKNYFKY